jgi:hypothetical protein
MILYKRFIRIIILICIVVSPNILLGQDYGDYTKPIDISESIAMIKSSISNACYFGMGRQRTKLNISTQKINHQSSNFLIDFDTAPSILFGCFLNNLEVSFAINHVSYKLSNEISYLNKDYNSITYYQNTASLGYLAQIWLKFFYIGSGIVYSNTRYQLGYFNSETEEDYSNEMENDSQFMYYLNLVGVITPTLFINLKQQKSFSNKHFIQEQLQLGVNFYTSF